MAGQDGRHATQPYRARVGTVWYWIDPTVPAEAIEPGDAVILYPVSGDATLPTLQGRFPADNDAARSIDFATLDGERFTVHGRDIAAMQLATVDEHQT